MKKIIYIYWVIVLLQYTPVFASVVDYRIHINTLAIVQKEVIYIFDIATVTGNIPSHIQKILQEKALWHSPKALGEKQYYSHVLLKKKMQEVLGKDAIFCTYPTSLLVQRGGAILLQKEIEEYIRAELQKEPIRLNPQSSYNTKVALEDTTLGIYTNTIVKKEYVDFRLPDYILLKNSTDRIELRMRRSVVGRNTATIVVIDELGAEREKIPISFTHNVYVEALCAKDNIVKGTVLEGVVQPCIQNISTQGELLSSNILKKGHTLVYRIKKSIGKGDVIMLSMVEKVPLVRKGSTVDLTYNKGGVLLSIKAEALTDATIGDTIKVRQIESKKHIYAQVVNATTVRIP